MRLQLPKPFSKSDKRAYSTASNAHKEDVSSTEGTASAPLYTFPEATSAEEEPIIPHHSIFEKLANFDAQSVRELKTRREALDGFPTASHCAVHLLLLELFWKLRHDVVHNGDLDESLGRKEIMLNGEEDEQFEREAERRWRAFAEVGVGRFKIWQQHVNNELQRIASKEGTVELPAGHMPPIDVLMVWHAYTLNPRCFYEDCVRHDKLEFWHMSFPWKAVYNAIDQRNLTYSPSDSVQQVFKMTYGAPFDLYAGLFAGELNHGMSLASKDIECPSELCTHLLILPVTDVKQDTGFLDAHFEATCEKCGTKVTTESLSLHYLQTDLQKMQIGERVMRGMALSKDGHPVSTRDIALMEYIAKNPTLEKSKTANTDETTLESRSQRVKSLYISNPSSIYFSIDLASAVIRQGSFIDKMHNYLWIRSPSLHGTLHRAISRYENFFHLFKTYPNDVMVPCLDVDIVWHTQLTFASHYYAFSISRTNNVFIDHDDKIEKEGLDSSWDKTREVWKAEFGGGDDEPTGYGRCLCWDCEVVRDRGELVWYSPRKWQEKRRGEQEKMMLAYYRCVEEARKGRKMLPAID